jgi:heterotetrameric sarcosine oxidase gamma subunit
VSTVADPFAFLSPAAASGDAELRTPMERSHLAAGAEIQSHEGWRIAVYPDNGPVAAWAADLSHHGKIDVRGPAAQIDEITGRLDLGRASSVDGVWTLRLSPTHAVVLCPFGRVDELRTRIAGQSEALCVVDMTCGWAAVMIGGEKVREVFMRSSSLDVRPHRFPHGACTAGSVMRCGSILLNDEDRLWVLCGWEFGEYMWDSLLDAGVNLGIAPVSAGVALGREVTA